MELTADGFRYEDDPFCPRHGRESRPTDTPGLRCDCKPAMVSCNRHADCDKADRMARRGGRHRAEHCHDECCEECFGY